VGQGRLETAGQLKVPPSLSLQTCPPASGLELSGFASERTNQELAICLAAVVSAEHQSDEVPLIRGDHLQKSGDRRTDIYIQLILLAKLYYKGHEQGRCHAQSQFNTVAVV
jgi:hypothetical protein